MRQLLCNDLIKHGMEFVRALNNHHYDVTPAGIHFPKQRAIVAGLFRHHASGDGLGLIEDPNVVPTEALNYLLKAGYKNSGGLSNWYIAPFTGAVVPGAGLTAANADSTLTEFTDYDEATRQAWTLPADPTSGQFTNSASPATFTASSAVGTGAGVDVYGAFIISSSAKEATTGKIGPAAQFSAARNLKATDVLSVAYTLSATSTS
jgi:hypothetical protein